jgi:hypothetical protein
MRIPIGEKKRIILNLRIGQTTLVLCCVSLVVPRNLGGAGDPCLGMLCTSTSLLQAMGLGECDNKSVTASAAFRIRRAGLEVPDESLSTNLALSDTKVLAC